MIIIAIFTCFYTFTNAENCYVCQTTKREVKDKFLQNDRPSSGSVGDDCWHLNSDRGMMYCDRGCYHLFFAYRFAGVGELGSNVESTTVERGCRYFKYDGNGKRYLFPSEEPCLNSEKPDGCKITLTEENYGNYGELDAYYYTDSLKTQEFPTNTRLPPDLNWSQNTGLSVCLSQQDQTSLVGLKCNQCMSMPNVTRPERDRCYNDPRKYNFYCNDANYTSCDSTVGSYKIKYGQDAGTVYEYADRGCSKEYTFTPSKISYTWINGDIRNLRQNPGTNVSLETHYCQKDGCNREIARYTTNGEIKIASLFYLVIFIWNYL